MESITPCSEPIKTDTPLEQVEITQLDGHVSRCVDNPQHIPLHRDPRFFLSVVLDLDQTLINAQDRRLLTVRPYARTFLKKLHDLPVEVIVWSAGTRVHVDRCLRSLDPEGKYIHHAICRGTSWLDGSIAMKDLSLLPDRAASSFLIDDSPYVSVRSGSRALVVPPFLVSESAQFDTTLLFVLNVIMFVVGVVSSVAPSTPPSTPPSSPTSSYSSQTSSHSSSQTQSVDEDQDQSSLDGDSQRSIFSEQTTRVYKRVAAQHITSRRSSTNSSKTSVTSSSIEYGPLLYHRKNLGAKAERQTCQMSTEVKMQTWFASLLDGDYSDQSPECLDCAGHLIGVGDCVEVLDNGVLATVLRSHPFLAPLALPSAHGPLTALVLDVVDTGRLGARVTAYLKDYCTELTCDADADSTVELYTPRLEG